MRKEKKPREYYFNRPKYEKTPESEAYRKKQDEAREARRLAILKIIRLHDPATAAIIIESKGTFWEDFD